MSDLKQIKSRQLQADRHRVYRVFQSDGPIEASRPWVNDLIGERRVLVVTTPSVAEIYGGEIHRTLIEGRPQASLFVLRCDETTKTVETMLEICHRAQKCALDRKSVLIGVGGGVCTDLTSFAASQLRRGLDCIRIPSTLIGQVDAGVGIKSAVNFSGRKSYLGAYHAPLATIIAPRFLRSLAPRFIRTGFAEILKMAIIDSPALFDLVEANHRAIMASRCAEPERVVADIVWRSADLMLNHLEPNLYEDRTFKRHVDFGHSFSPLLESASGYAIAHGEAVAIDMAACAVMARLMGLLDAAEEMRILELLHSVGLPIHSPLMDGHLCLRALEEAARHRGGAPNLVMPARIGETIFIERLGDVTPALIEATLSRLSKLARSLAGRVETASSLC